MIVSEFVTAQGGLGYIIVLASANLQTDLLFAALLWVSLIDLTSYGSVLLLERPVVARMGGRLSSTPA